MGTSEIRRRRFYQIGEVDKIFRGAPLQRIRETGCCTHPDIAESGKPMDEKKFTEEKICYKANAHPACICHSILSLQSIERRSKLEKAIDVNCKAQQISVNLDHLET